MPARAATAQNAVRPVQAEITIATIAIAAAICSAPTPAANVWAATLSPAAKFFRKVVFV